VSTKKCCIVPVVFATITFIIIVALIIHFLRCQLKLGLFTTTSPLEAINDVFNAPAAKDSYSLIFVVVHITISRLDYISVLPLALV